MKELTKELIEQIQMARRNKWSLETLWWNIRWILGYRIGGFTFATRGGVLNTTRTNTIVNIFNNETK